MLALACSTVRAATLETEPTFTFTKEPFDDPTLEATQDRISDNVWITRADVEGIYNAAVEPNYTRHTSPLGVEWALGTLDDDIDSLTFDSWFNTIGGNPPSSVGQNMVIHIPADNAYYNLRFTSWGQGSGSGGGFSYLRSLNPLVVPEPSSIAMIGIAAVALVGWRARKR